MFLEWCSELKLASFASFFKHKFIQRATWYSNNGKCIRVYDHILGNSWVQKHVSDCRVRNSIKIDSDHRPLVATFKFPAFRRDRKLTKKRKNCPKKQRKLQYNLLRKDKVVNEQFLAKVASGLESLETHDMSDLYELLESASVVIPEVPKRKIVHPWDNDLEMQSLLKKRDKTDRKTENVEFKSLTRNIRKRAKILKNEFYEKKAAAINLSYVNRELEKSYYLSKSHKMGADTKNGMKCDPDVLRNFVKDHLNKLPPDNPPSEITNSIPDCIKTTSQIPFDDSCLSAGAPSRDELLFAVRNLKNNKSSTDIAAECIKCAIEIGGFVEVLHAGVTTIWNEKSIPENWRLSRITSLFKKGDRSLPENYRTLSVSAVMIKVIMSIVLVRSSAWYESQLHDGQNGFRKKRGCMDAVFTVKNLTRIAKTKGKSIFSVMIDLKAAYDWIARQWVFLCIAARNADSEYAEEINGLFEFVRVLYAETRSYMAGEQVEDAFETTSGLLQGGVESPPLFNLFCDVILRLFLDRSEREGIGGVKFRYFIPASASTREQRLMSGLSSGKGADDFIKCYYTAYCDDIILYAESIAELQKMTQYLEEFFVKFGLVISIKKTKTMILNYTGKPEDYPKSIITIQNTNVENVKIFKYLGVKLDFQQYDTGKTEIKHRINSANNKFRELKHVFTNQSIKLGIRLLFYHSYVRSRLCYLCGCWSISQKLRNKVKTCQMKHLRTIVGGGWKRKGGATELMEEVGYNYAYVYKNNKIYEICRTSSVLDFVDEQNAKWCAHVVRCDNDMMVKQTMFEESQTSRLGTSGVTSILDKFLKMTRAHHMEDTDVYKACIARDLFFELEERGFVLTSQHIEIE